MKRVVVITGASRGIGAATAELLAKEGWKICVNYRRDAEAAQAVVAKCEEQGAHTIAVQADVSVEEEVIQMFREVDDLGVLGALVNNVGIVGPKARVDSLTSKRIEEMMRVNVIGPFICSREAVNRMSKLYGGSGGAIVNVSSAASRLGSPGEYVDYAASKGAIDTMTIGLSREVAAEGIRVNCVRPGFIETDIHASGGQPNRLDELEQSIPMKRRGYANEVAEAISWLCSDRASYVTGAFIDIAGGR